MAVHSALTAAIVLLATSPVLAGFFAAPGDLRLRHDLQLLDDAGLADIPLTTWPLPWLDIVAAVDGIDPMAIGDAERLAYERVRSAATAATRSGQLAYRWSAGAAIEPRVIRTFEDTPRDEAQLTAGIDWSGARFAADVRLTAVANPDDGDEIRTDGSYVGAALGNWLVTAGWQERWWGPGRDGSLILSSNARPFPALAIQRRQSTAFESRWLRWIGPWTVSSFIGLLDDERTVDNTLLFGARVAFRPLQSLEIGVSRTAQWCGDGRPCSGSTFVDLLLGNDNRGVNVDPESEPGNQLAGVDVRWRLPAGWPLAAYAQWIGEDTRQGGPLIGSWLRQAGLEHWGTLGGLHHRTHLEVTETSCRAGGLGFSGAVPDCAYEHSIYRTGFRFRGRALAHGSDSDSRSYTIGATLIQSAGHRWNASLRYMVINRLGQPISVHTLTQTPRDHVDLQVSYSRSTSRGRFHLGLGYRYTDTSASSQTFSGMSGFLTWSSQ